MSRLNPPDSCRLNRRIVILRSVHIVTTQRQQYNVLDMPNQVMGLVSDSYQMPNVMAGTISANHLISS